MTDYKKDINKTEGVFGEVFTAVVGTGGVEAGKPVKMSADRKVVKTTANTDKCIGIAKDSVAEHGSVAVLGDGCLVEVPFTLTAGNLVGIDGGDLENYTSKTIVGYTYVGGTGKSIVRVKLQYVMV